jgi:hypothetical protein
VTVVADLLAGDIVDSADIARVLDTSTRSVARLAGRRCQPPTTHR